MFPSLFRRDHSMDNQPPPDLPVRRFGRWTCGATLPQGRPASSFDLLCHLGPGQGWRVVVDVDGFAQLQLVEHRGRSHQGCWAELGTDEVLALDRITRGEGLCDLPDDSHAADGSGWFDVALNMGGTSCTRHLAAALLQKQKSGRGRRFAQDVRAWLDRVSNGSFRSVEAFATEGRENPRAAPPVTKGRLTCAPDHPTIYANGDTWMLDYSFQKGLLWQRNLEISARGEVALSFASLQNASHTSCTGRLTEPELTEIGSLIDEAGLCRLKTGQARAKDAHGYLSVRRNAVDCRYRPLRHDDVLDSYDGRRFDRLVTTLVANLVGPGGVDPFDRQVGLLYEGRPAGLGVDVTTPRARANTSPPPGAPARDGGFASR
jgi:hypothetical protein